MKSLKLGIVGAKGRMGSRVIELAHELDGVTVTAAIECAGHAAIDQEILPGLYLSSDMRTHLAGCDVYIDFSTPESALRAAAAANESRVAAVIGTTGLSSEQLARLSSCCSNIPWILAPNMSLGVALVARLAGDVAKALGEEYEPEIIETHHRRKVDSPSGTALLLARRVCEARGWSLDDVATHGREGAVGPRSSKALGIHAVRGGDVVGEHRVVFLGPGESIEIVHRAESRDNFARGAIRAAQFIVDKDPGRYEIADVVLGGR